MSGVRKCIGECATANGYAGGTGGGTRGRGWFGFGNDNRAREEGPSKMWSAPRPL
jgi:hypothetical protein